MTSRYDKCWSRKIIIPCYHYFYQFLYSWVILIQSIFSFNTIKVDPLKAKTKTNTMKEKYNQLDHNSKTNYNTS